MEILEHLNNAVLATQGCCAHIIVCLTTIKKRCITGCYAAAKTCGCVVDPSATTGFACNHLQSANILSPGINPIDIVPDRIEIYRR